MVDFKKRLAGKKVAMTLPLESVPHNRVTN